MNHHFNVGHLGVQGVLLPYHISFIVVTSLFSFGSQLLVNLFLHKLSAFNFLGLGCKFLLDYLCVSFIEVLVQIIFDEDESHHKVISCMVGNAIFIEKMVQALSHQVIFHKLMVRFAVVLISYPLPLILSRKLKVITLFRIHLMVFRFRICDCWLLLGSLGFPDRLVFGNFFWNYLILLQRTHKTLHHMVCDSWWLFHPHGLRFQGLKLIQD